MVDILNGGADNLFGCRIVHFYHIYLTGVIGFQNFFTETREVYLVLLADGFDDVKVFLSNAIVEKFAVYTFSHKAEQIRIGRGRDGRLSSPSSRGCSQF